MIQMSVQHYLEKTAADKVASVFESPEIEVAIATSIAFLQHDKAKEMLALDPYWPKWDGPWWHMLALAEIGASDRIPASAFTALLTSIAQNHLSFFPLEASELPSNCDPYRQVMCFCALGSMLKMAAQANVDVFQAIPWAEDWFFTYVLPDGGYNCDEQAYVRATPHSSFTSSLPMYEALLLLKKDFPASKAILMDGAHYLQRREFCKSLSKQCVADPQWLIPGFPLFYEYDVLRGMQYVVDVHQAYAEPLDLAPFSFAFMAVYDLLMKPHASFRQPENYETFTLRFQAGNWAQAEIGGFPLLQWLKQPSVLHQAMHQRFFSLCKALSSKTLLLKS